MILNWLPDGGLVITKNMFSIFSLLRLCGQFGLIEMKCVFREEAGSVWTRFGAKLLLASGGGECSARMLIQNYWIKICCSWTS
jgi:hypothetical protein